MPEVEDRRLLQTILFYDLLHRGRALVTVSVRWYREQMQLLRVLVGCLEICLFWSRRFTLRGRRCLLIVNAALMFFLKESAVSYTFWRAVPPSCRRGGRWSRLGWRWGLNSELCALRSCRIRQQ